MALKGRDKEANLIRDVNVACAAGRLLLGELSSWEEFLEPDLVNYSELPRKQLKSGKYDIKTNLQQRIDNFCKSNFPKMSCSKLVMLFEELKAHRRLEIPYLDFCKKYSPINDFHKKGYPMHSTVCISLWGLQYRFPEHDFSNDLVISLNQLIEAEAELDTYRNAEHEKLKYEKNNISSLVRKSESSKRQVMQASFSILECYLNDIAWEFHNNEGQTLSKGKTKLLKDISNVTLRDKIRKYPLTIFGKELDEKTYKYILDEAKQYRDSLMHPSLFSAPEKFGGYDKLAKLYNIDMEIIVKTVFGVIKIVEEIETMKGKNTPELIWLPEVKEAANQAPYQWIRLVVVYLLIPLVLLICGGNLGWWQAWLYSLLILAVGIEGRMWAEQRHPGITAERQNTCSTDGGECRVSYGHCGRAGPSL